MSEILSYANFLKDQKEFKKSGSKSSSDFNYYDTPSHKYFKILFYFGDTSYTANDNGLSNGLLHPTWEIFGDKSPQEAKMIGLEYYNYNSAWSYLKLNDENERAEKLEKFVTLLSNINTYSPWYFQSISGIDTALERKPTEGTSFEIGDEPKKITINCLPDAFDNRIGTLLDLYRDITWSWSQKKEIIPANLRKFDMAIYIFESPIKFWHDFENDNLTATDRYIPSYKMLEFHDCEIIYNSSKSGWGDLNNQTGLTPTYNIEIAYNDCYDISYNEILMKKIGDVIKTDTYQAIANETGAASSIKSETQSEELKQINAQIIGFKERNEFVNNSKHFTDSEDIYSYGNLGDRWTYGYGNIETQKVKEDSLKPIPGFIENAAGQLAGTAVSYVKHKINRAVLGNLYSYSLTKIASQIDDAIQGNIIKTGQSVKQYIENAQQRAAAKVKTSNNLGNLYKNTIANN